ncbi:MAG: hypothetical protein VKJ24_21405 [Synechococcales bacterium]|nr:hypothetical protein [Synechococcales bacterium]
MNAVEQLKQQLDIPMTIREALADSGMAAETDFYQDLETMAEQAFDDQCTGANPRYPLIQDLKELYLLAYQGCRIDARHYHLTETLV